MMAGVRAQGGMGKLSVGEVSTVLKHLWETVLSPMETRHDVATGM